MCQTERARYRRRRHNKHVRIISFAHELLTLRHAKFMLFVNNDQAGLWQIEAGGKQRVRPNKKNRLLVVTRCDSFRPCGCRFEVRPGRRAARTIF